MQCKNFFPTQAGIQTNHNKKIWWKFFQPNPTELQPVDLLRHLSFSMLFHPLLIKCVFYSAERSQLITDNPCVGISAKGGKASKKKDALTDQQVAVLLDTVKELPPYLFIMIGLYSGLRREEILALQWDCVFLDESTTIHFCDDVHGAQSITGQ